MAWRLAIEYGDFTVAYEEDADDVRKFLANGTYDKLVAAGTSKVMQVVESGVLDSADGGLEEVLERLTIDGEDPAGG